MSERRAEPTMESAATALLLRERGDALEVLLVRRSRALAFHGGAWVFPGGRVDPADAPSAAESARDDVESARRAAVRETREETGLTLAASELIAVSHWTTPPGRPRRFATWFFASPARGDEPIVVDGEEIDAFRWLSPRAALAARAEGHIDLPPPTFVTLSVLQEYPSAAAALASFAARVPPRYVPRPVPVSGGMISLLEGDAGYASGALDAPGVRHRVHMLASGWRYERSAEVG